MSKTQFNCYIDESGDEGLSPKSKQWFVVSAVVVSEEETQVRGFEDECKQIVWTDNNHSHPPTQLHFRNLRHSQKLGVVRLFTQRPFTHISMAFWKPELKKETVFGECQSFYRYAIRYLLERVSWYIRDRYGEGNLIFSNRRNFKVSSLIDYIIYWMKSPQSQIYMVFDRKKIRACGASEDEMLRAADICASSIGCALNADEYGIIKPYYASELISHFYRYRNGQIWTYGFKTFPCQLVDALEMNPHIVDWLK